jgi:hypothetical protein
MFNPNQVLDSCLSSNTYALVCLRVLDQLEFEPDGFYPSDCMLEPTEEFRMRLDTYFLAFVAHIRHFLEACAKHSPTFLRGKKGVSITKSLNTDFGPDFGALYSKLSELVHVPDDIATRSHIPTINPRSIGAADWGGLKAAVQVLQPFVPQAWRDSFGADCQLTVTRRLSSLIDCGISRPTIVIRDAEYRDVTYFY